METIQGNTMYVKFIFQARMTLLQTSQNSWQNKMGKKDVVVKPNRTSRLSVILYQK